MRCERERHERLKGTKNAIRARRKTIKGAGGVDFIEGTRKGTPSRVPVNKNENVKSFSK